jgi:hypothetical protein
MINLINNTRTNYDLEISNYSVPFDFDDTIYLWLDYLESSQRAICVYNFNTLKVFSHQIGKDFGHVSHMKLLPNNRVFLVRNHSLCEIREMNEDFKLIQSFYNLGKIEILAVDVGINSTSNMRNNKNSENSVIPVDNFIFTLLDWEGNVNVWINFMFSKKFNLFEMNDIKEEYKKKRFFNMNYPYHIKYCKNFFAVSTDFGCFVIKKN